MKIDDRVTDPAPRLEDAQKCATLPALSARPNSLQDVADLAAKITRASGAALALAKPTGEIVCAARSGEAAPAVGAVLDSSHGISAACVRKIEVQHCTDTEADPRVDAEVCRRLGIRSILVLPLHRGGRVAGLLSVYSRYASNFDHHDVAGLEYLQSVAAWLPDAEPPKAQLAQAPVADRLAHEKPLMEAAEPETVSTPEINATARDYKQATKDNAEFESQLNGSVAPVSEPGVDELAGWLQPQRSTRLRPLFISLGIIAIAALVLAGSRFIRMHSSHSSLQRAPAVVMSETPPSTASSPFVSLPTEPPQSIAETSAAAESAPDAGVGHVQSINSMVGPGYARVTIGLDHGVQYTAFRLDRPERICFDLRNTRFSPSVRRRTIAVSGLALRSIRSSQYQQNVVRVVLDLNTRAAYSVAYQADPPRLVIEVNSGREEHRGTANSLAAAPTARADASASGAKELVIALDPGHGGDDLGAVGRQGLQEKQLVLDVALRLGALLKSELRAKVIYTRRDDQLVPIEQRSTPGRGEPVHLHSRQWQQRPLRDRSGDLQP